MVRVRASNAIIETVLGSILASSNTEESEKRHMEQFLITEKGSNSQNSGSSFATVMIFIQETYHMRNKRRTIGCETPRNRVGIERQRRNARCLRWAERMVD
jgi:hypothetical protein